MRKIFMIAAASGAVLAGLSAQAAPPLLGDKASGVSGAVIPVKIDAKLYDYCAKVITDVKRGKSTSKSSQYSATDCMEIFAMAEAGITAAEPGQPGRGGAGGGVAGLPGGAGGAAGGGGGGGAGGLPGGAGGAAGATPAEPGQAGRGGAGGGVAGLPGGQGGAAGNAGGAGGSAAAMPVDEELLDYCGEVLKRARPGATAKGPVKSEDFQPSDCVEYFGSLAPSGAGGKQGATGGRDGADGPSIAGGKGGKGGQSGSGSGGGSGGAGGAGVAGRGGKGGAGGSTD